MVYGKNLRFSIKDRKGYHVRIIVPTNTGFWYDASYEPLEVFVISIWFVQSFVEYKVIVGPQNFLQEYFTFCVKTCIYF